ncbi:MAG: DNA gyrase subunit B, partial [Gaiellaceae bacterium]
NTLTEARWGRFVRALAEFEGWSARLKADHGSAAGDFVVEHRLVETDVALPGDAEPALAALGPNGYELAVVETADTGFRVKVIETETSAASHVTVPADLLSSPVYASLRRTYARLSEIVGAPPFTLVFGKKRAVALRFEALRDLALELAKEGMQVSRFKGLGEMNADELRETTMDPANRMLIRVDVEDESAADRIFSTLMGDQVEPRRDFIVANAKDVRFLDV